MAFNSSARPAIDPPSPFSFSNNELRTGPFALRSESTESFGSESASPGQHDGIADSGGEPHRYRTIWLSDIHLGSGGCQAPYLLDFLRHHESEYLYLVGDIIDGWQLRKGWFWPQAHNDVVQKILR